jgi:hypothetical protein
MPYLEGCLIVDALGGRLIEDERRCGDSFPSEPTQHGHGFYHTPFHAQDGSIMPLHHPILLQRVEGSEVTLDVVVDAVVEEVMRFELVVVIGT